MPTSWLNYVDQKIFYDKYPVSMKYMYSLYYSTLYLGLNEIGPSDKFEIFGTTTLFIMSNFINAFFLTGFASLFTTLLEGSMFQQMRLDELNNILFFIEMPDIEAAEIR